MDFFGRRKILTAYDAITRDNVLTVLTDAFKAHTLNRGEIQYLYDYYCGNQPALRRRKKFREDIKNCIVENRANEIVAFKVGYLMGEPIQYVSKTDDATVAENIRKLNDYMASENKAAKDKELADWSHICGTSYRMILPGRDSEEDEAPFEVYTMDPRSTFVVYRDVIGQPPIMAVTYVKRQDGTMHYSVYTEDRYYEIVDMLRIVRDEPQVLGIPIIEYPANNSRIGAFEVVLPLLDAINTVDSNRVDGVEQFVQAIMLFHNVDISEADFDSLMEKGALKIKDVDPTLKAEVKYLTEELNQSQTQTLIDHLYSTVLTICGIPNRNGSASTSDTGSAVILRDGWSSAEARAKDSELMFKSSEKEFLKLVLRICRNLRSLTLKLSNIEIHFTRRNYENIAAKSEVLIAMLNSNKIAPQLAFQHCGMFADPEAAYLASKQYEEEYAEREVGELTRIAGVRADV